MCSRTPHCSGAGSHERAGFKCDHAPCSHLPCPGWRRHATCWVVSVLLVSLGCSDDRSTAGPRVDDPLPADVEVGADAPVDLSYVCGNRFLVSNAHSVPIRVTYRVAGSSEDGTVEVPAAPSEDPAVSEQMIETRTKGTVQILLDGKPLVARANGGVPCTPAPPPSALLMAAGHGCRPVVRAVQLADRGRAHDAPPRRAGPLHRAHGGAAGLEPRHGCLRVGAQPRPALLRRARAALRRAGAPRRAGTSARTTDSPTSRSFRAPAAGPPARRWRAAAGIRRPRRWAPARSSITAGRDEAGVVVTVPEVWSNGSLRRLTGAAQVLPYYPRAFLTPNGSLYVTGPTRNTRFLSTSGSGSWKKGPSAAVREPRVRIGGDV